VRTFLYGLWLVSLLVGLFCMGLFIQGLVRDQRTGQPDVALDLSGTPSIYSTSFTVWRPGQYDLALSSVNHTPPFGAPFRGTLEVALTDAGGREILTRTVDSTSGHARPGNMSWTPLDSIRLERSMTGKSTLSARLIEPDPRFAGVRTRLHLRLRQDDPGMGGLVNYVALAPGILFTVIALATSISISQRGWGAGPFRLTAVLAAIAGLAAIVLRRS
jgi:hypothetical protein